MVELAATAGLLAVGAPGDLPESWLPTDAYDAWARKPAAERWADLARAWLASPRTSGNVGSRDAAGKSLNALSPGLVDPHLVDTRWMALLQAGRAARKARGWPPAPGSRPWSPGSAGCGRAGPRAQGPLVAWSVEEAAMLGVTGLGALSAARPGAARRRRRRPRAGALEPLLPAPLDHILVQGDLTAIAPGPLESHLAARLHQVADVESRGGATVYRFSAVARSAGRSTPAGPRRSSTPSSTTCRAPRCRSR